MCVCVCVRACVHGCICEYVKESACVHVFKDNMVGVCV